MKIKPNLYCYDGNFYNDMTVIPKPINMCTDRSWKIYDPNGHNTMPIKYFSGNQVCNWFFYCKNTRYMKKKQSIPVSPILDRFNQEN